MIPPYEPEAPHCRFLGFPMLQNRLAMPAWSYLIERVEPALMIEIGCWKGGFACALAVAMRNYGGRVFCCDIAEFGEDLIPWRKVLPLHFEQIDARSDGGIKLISGLIERAGICAVLCDGDDKQKDFAAFAPYLKKGDIIAAHDLQHPETWPWSEIDEASVRPVCHNHGLEPFMQGIFSPAGWLVRRKL